MRLHIAVAMLCVAFTLAGCLVPVPGGLQGRAIDDDLVSAIKVGSTTREEVLTSWGEPTSKTDDFLRYSWHREGWVAIWLAPVIGKCVYNATYYDVRVFFDERDRVLKIQRNQWPVPERCHKYDLEP
jgi:hypothetical protein